MKLLMCLSCHDIFNLRHKEKTCGCGKVKGSYLDSLNAEYSGDAMPIGFANSTFRSALMDQRIANSMSEKHTMGREFTAFFIPDSASTIKKIENT